MRDSVKPPLISVVTVCRNDLEGLKATCASLAAQTHTNIQHIVIDGASTDGTVEFLAEYKPSFSVSKTSEPDGGIFDAMNKSFGRVEGDLVVFMNSGDVFGSPESLNLVAQSHDAKRWKWAYGCVRYVDRDGEALGAVVQAPFNRRRLILGTMFVPHQAMYLDADLFSSLGRFDVRAGIAADQDMAIRAALRAEPTVIYEFLCDFLVGGAHSSGTRFSREWLYHGIRSRNGVLVGHTALTDLLVTVGLATKWSLRDFAVLVVKHQRPRR